MIWLYNKQEYTYDENKDKDLVGFVYQITNLVNGRKYIGKKFFWATKTYQKDKKKKRKKVVSDWLSYYGSNDALKKDIEKHGQENFKREILVLCKNKTECAYYEAKFQFQEDVLFRGDYYNDWIMVRCRKSNLMKKEK